MSKYVNQRERPENNGKKIRKWAKWIKIFSPRTSEYTETRLWLNCSHLVIVQMALLRTAMDKSSCFRYGDNGREPTSSCWSLLVGLVLPSWRLLWTSLHRVFCVQHLWSYNASCDFCIVISHLISHCSSVSFQFARLSPCLRCFFFFLLPFHQHRDAVLLLLILYPHSLILLLENIFPSLLLSLILPILRGPT